MITITQYMKQTKKEINKIRSINSSVSLLCLSIWVMCTWPQTMNWFFEPANCDRRCSRCPSIFFARRKERSLDWCSENAVFLFAHWSSKAFWAFFACCGRFAYFTNCVWVLAKKLSDLEQISWDGRCKPPGHLHTCTTGSERSRDCRDLSSRKEHARSTTGTVGQLPETYF